MQTQKTSPWLILFRIVFTVALLGCIAYIFRNSLQTGAESSLRSQAEQDTRSVTAPVSGTFSALVDGYETLITPDTLGDLTPSSLEALLEKARTKPVAPMSSTTTEITTPLTC